MLEFINNVDGDVSQEDHLRELDKQRKTNKYLNDTLKHLNLSIDILIEQYDPVRLATPVIETLALAIGHTVAIAVWGTRGPTIVRVAEGPTPVHISMRHGTVMSLAGTASGRLFAAWRPEEAARLGEPLPDSATLAEVKAQGHATSRDGVIAGVSAVAAPVFEASGRLVMSLTAIGPSASFDTAPDGTLVAALREAAALLSRRLGR